MRYLSTRGGAPVSAAQAIINGICPSGGLYVPEQFPQVSISELHKHTGDYLSIAHRIISPYLDTPKHKLQEMLISAYGRNFDSKLITPLVQLSEHESILELWHGPTLAFKDLALQLLPHLMCDSSAQIKENKQIYILVATSGDTGKAALSGFQGVNGTKIQVFYPYGGISRAQWLQMVTQEGSNVAVCGINGSFDDAQTAIKKVFGDEAIRNKAEKLGYRLTSANSINFGRLLPQIVYYFFSYLELCKTGCITFNEPVNYCVPTGNFGDILAGYYAMRMGLPVNKLICASNRNNVLTDFFNSGIYNAKRPFYKNMSCSIDILISSNLERLLFEVLNRDSTRVSNLMHSLNQTGGYSLEGDIQAQLNNSFYADWCCEEDTLSTINTCFNKYGYLMDPHTAVAKTVLDRYSKEGDSPVHTILLSTANPFKFATEVLKAFELPDNDDFKNALRLSAFTGNPIPSSISKLMNAPVLHNKVCDIHEIPERVLEIL